MAEMARDYHDNIQSRDKLDEYARVLATTLVLEQCETHLNQQQHNSLDPNLSSSEVSAALRMSKNGSAPVLDGLPYEFYKWLEIEHKIENGKQEESVDIIEILVDVFRDIETHGIAAGTDF
ncbi:hypothetical protein C8R45DRAFT_756656, partial [Mycena sanguinolenta]